MHTLKESRTVPIGADNREKRFYPLDDVTQYDQAKVGDLLRAALEPMPEFTVLPFETESAKNNPSPCRWESTAQADCMQERFVRQ